MGRISRFNALGLGGLGLAAAAACTSGEPAAPTNEAPMTGAAQPSTNGPTFHKDVAPIMQRVCQRCHVAGGIAPFALASYTDAKNVASSIVVETNARRMPPWGAQTTSECTPPHAWQDDLRLSEKEIATLKEWHEAGDLEGNPTDAPPPIDRQVQPSLKDGLSLATNKPFKLAAATKDTMQCFLLDPKIDRTMYLNGTFFVPQNKTIVHHALAFIVPPDAKVQGKTPADEKPLEEASPWECFGGPHVTKPPRLVAAWAPGAVPADYPPDVGLPLEPGTRFVMQVHYHPHASATSDADATAFQYRLTETPPTWISILQLVGNFQGPPKGTFLAGLLPGADDPATGVDFVIPANKKDHVEQMTFTLPVFAPQLRIAGLGAHMHLAGKDEKITLKSPGKEDVCLLQEPAWSFDWQRGYRYDVPIDQLPIFRGGDTINIRCTYDNTKTNTKMMAAALEQGFTEPRDIRLGESTTDEMCLTGLMFVKPRVD